LNARLMRTLLILALAIALASCGGGDGGEQPASSGSCPSDAVTIKMADIKFNPEKASAKVGQTVCWVNEDTVDHDAVAESGADFKSELFGKGETFSAKLDKAGTVEYECTIHPGMTGEIDVQ
jgi:plastocyanin